MRGEGREGKGGEGRGNFVCVCGPWGNSSLYSMKVFTAGHRIVFNESDISVSSWRQSVLDCLNLSWNLGSHSSCS